MIWHGDESAGARSAHWWLRGLLPVMLAAGAGCAPELDTEPTPAFMEFDTQATPPRVPEPTHVILNPVTGKIDFSLSSPSLELPADCAAQTVLPQAQCELYTYLETLDGYPTLSTARAPASAPLDGNTFSGNVVVVDGVAMQTVAITSAFDPESQSIVISSTGGLELGHWYFPGVRGYANGIRTAATEEAPAREVVAPVPYVLLKEDQNVSCGATNPADVPSDCPTVALFTSSLGEIGAKVAVVRLEALRVSYAQLNTTAALAGIGGIPENELAMFWAFPTHTNPVVELLPFAIEPRKTGARELRLKVKGALNPATIKAATSADAAGNVILMDVGAYTAGPQAGNLAASLLLQSVTFDATDLVLTTAADLPTETQLVILIANSITSPEGKPLVASPVTVFLTAQGPLLVDGKSQISSLTTQQATVLEGSRASAAPLVAAFVQAGIPRNQIAYFYGFAAP